ncbi:phosphotransferase enzyme family protein [Calidifontibacillus erzurumensis]|uniref:phosphotransferase enzyme family protein n=1 Tax=Calidifontibacillus erzurumensis TaxID=2741433 RepID=UPI0035B561D4
MSDTKNYLNDVLDKFTQIAKRAILFYPFQTQETIQLLNYSENATFLVKNTITGEKYILRVGRPGYHTKEEIEGEIAWIKSIDELSTITVSLPIKAENGQYIQEITDENNTYYCTLFTFLEGKAPDENDESALIDQFEILGEITAKLHEHSIKFRDRLRNIKRLTWNYDTILGSNPKWGKWQNGLGMTQDRLALFEKVSEKIFTRLKNFGNGPDRFGLIHSDLRLANLLIDGDNIKVIDFDDCGFGYYLYDLATSLSFIEHKPYVPALIDAWIKGYQKIRPLSNVEKEEIPTFIMMRRLQLIAWIGSRDNETTRQLGSKYTEDTDLLAFKYLQNTII